MESIERLNYDEHFENESVEEKESMFNVIKGYVIEMIIYLAISLMIILFLRAFVIQHVRVSGSSMEPTLHDRQHLLIEKVSYKFQDVKRFDVIVFQPYADDKDLFYIKRVIGLPGETIKIENNTIYINDKVLNDPYNGDAYIDAKLAKDTILLGPEDYFVLGDNREVSKDSREKEIGLLTYDSIIGKAMTKIYPFNDVGKVK
jgi:signal peptidase I